MTQYVNEAHGYSLKNIAPIGARKGQEVDEDGNIPGLPIFSYYESHVTSSVTHVYISQNIGAPAAYIQLVQFLNTRQQGDMVHMHFNCYGGRLDAGIQILTAMQNCQAQIIGHLDSVAYSMAALMFLNCDGHYISPFAKLMLHTYSGGGGGGKGPDQRGALDAADDTYARLVRDICVPFLTKREVKDMLENMRDMYFGYEDIVNRLCPPEKPKTTKRVKPAPGPVVEPVQEVHGGVAGNLTPPADERMDVDSQNEDDAPDFGDDEA